MINSTRYESDGLSVRESLQYGIPVICFDDVPALKANVKNFYNGLIVSKTHRVRNLASALEMVLSKPSIYKSITNKPLIEENKNKYYWEEFLLNKFNLD